MKATRDHKLVDRDEGEQKSEVAKVVIEQTKINCRQHPDREIEMYCGTHDMVYCLMCIAIEHRSCSDVTSLADVASFIFEQKEIDRLKGESEAIKEHLVDTERNKQDNIILVEKKINSIQNRIQEVEDSMMQHIKTLSKQANDNLEETYFKVKGELEADLTNVKYSISEVERVNEELQSASIASQEHKFVKVKLCQQIIKEAKSLNEKFETRGKLSVEFAENTNVVEQLLQVKTFGKINDACVNKKREIKCKKEVNVKQQDDQKTCRIIDVCQVDNGACVLADCTNKKLNCWTQTSMSPITSV